MTEIVIHKMTASAAEVAAMLGIEEQTLLNRRSANPRSVPPALNLEQKAPLWLIEDVLRWLRERSAYYQPETPQRKKRA